MTSSLTVAEPLKIKLPALHPGQQLVHNSPARFKVVVCGRRFGKTTYGIQKCVAEVLTTGGIYWWIGPTYSVSTLGWKMLKVVINQLRDAGIDIKTTEDDYTAVFSKGVICMKSGDNPDLLRGEKLSGVVFDEMAQHKEISWIEAIRPSLSDTRGWALFIGTPKGKNWVYHLYNRAGIEPNWAAFQLPTSVNPYIPKEEIEAARREYESKGQLSIFLQEYEADFGASQYLVWPEFNRTVHQWHGLVPLFTSFFGALDFGGTSIGSHKSTGLVAGRTVNDELILVEEFEQAGPNIAERQQEWMYTMERKVFELAKRSPKTNFSINWTADKTQMVGIQMMRRMGFSVFPTKGGPDSVEEGVELVHQRLKVRPDGKPRWYYMDHLHYVPEAMERYHYPQPEEGKVQAKKPVKIDDDMADTIRYLVERVDRTFIGDPAKIYKNALPMMKAVG